MHDREEAEADRAQAAAPGTDTEWGRRDWTLRAAMRTRQFWLMFLMWLVSMGIAEQLSISHQVYFYLDAGYEPMMAATFYSVFGICFAIGNVVGALSDRIGRERFFIPACFACAGFASLFFVMRDTSTPWLPPVIAIGFGTTFGSLCCVSNATLADLFSGRHYGRIAGSMILGFATGGTLSPWLAGHLHDVSGDYTATFAMLVGGLVLTALLMWLIAPGKIRPIGQRK